MSEIDAFLAKLERFRCERLSANLTVAQCDANRSRKGEYGKPGLPAVISCDGCAGLGKAVELEERVMAKSVAEIAAEKPWAVKVCTECKEPKKIHAHGQCVKCIYAKYGKSMRPPKAGESPVLTAKAVKPAPLQPTAVPEIAPEFAELIIEGPKRKGNPLLPKIPESHILLDLSDKPELFAWLEREAVTIEEIIELLNECYQGNVRKVS